MKKHTILRAKSANRNYKIEIRTYENYLEEDLSMNRSKDLEFLSAVSLGLNGRVKKIIKTGRYNVKMQNRSGCNAMHLAAKKNDKELLKMICDTGVSASLRKFVSPAITPFMIAAKHGCKESLIYLHKEARVNMKIKDSEGLNAIHYAAIGGNLDCFIYLVETAKLSYKDCSTENGNSALHWACKFGNLGIVRYCCETLKLDPHQYNYEGISTLRLAVENNKINTVMYLVNVWSVNSFLPDDRGISPITYAASHESLFKIFQYLAEIVPPESLIEGDLLLSRSIEDPPLTPLKAAVKYNNQKAIELILSKTEKRRRAYVYWISKKSNIMQKLSEAVIRNIINYT